MQERLKQPEIVELEIIKNGRMKGKLDKPSLDELVFIGERAFAMANTYYELCFEGSALLTNKLGQDPQFLPDKRAAISALGALSAELYVKSMAYRSGHQRDYLFGHSFDELFENLPDTIKGVIYEVALERGISQESFSKLLIKLKDVFVTDRYNYELFDFEDRFDETMQFLDIIKKTAEMFDCCCDAGKVVDYNLFEVEKYRDKKIVDEVKTEQE